MDNEKLYDFLKAAGKPMSIGQINAQPEFAEIPRQELARGLQQLASENIAFRSIREGKAYYSADPSEGVSRNPCQQYIQNIASAMNHGIAAAQNPEMAKMGELFRTLDGMVEPPEEGAPTPFAFTYHNGITADCDDYSISIPDGFKLEMGRQDRDFVAWLPGEDPDDPDNAQIVLYAGQMNGDAMNNIPDHMKDPELCGAIIRATQWVMKTQTDRLLGVSEMATIPLTGEVCGSYLYSSYNYQIMLGFPSGIKQMRVLANDLGSNRETYHQAVADWVGTLKLKQGFPAPIVLDTDAFLPLTKESLEQWGDDADKVFQRIGGIQNMNMQARIKQFHYDQQYGNGSATLLKKDIRAIAEKAMPSVEAACQSIVAFLKRACAAEPGNPLLLDLYKEASELLENLTLKFNLDDSEIKVVSPLRDQLFGELECPEIVLLKQEQEQLEAEKHAAEEAQRKAEEAERKRLEEERKRQEEEERKRKEEEKKRIEAERRAAEEKKRQEELERKRIEEEKWQAELARLEEESRKAAEEARLAAEKAEAERKAAEEAAARAKEEKKRRFRKRLKRTLITLLILVILLGAAAVLTPTVILPAIERMQSYKTAQEYLTVGRYDEAYDEFRALGDYKDSYELMNTSLYRKAEELEQNGQYAEAIALWQELGGYTDSAQRAIASEDLWRGPDYDTASVLMDQGSYQEAAALFDTLNGYKDSAQKAEECRALYTEQLYSQAQEAKAAGDYSGAMKYYEQLGDYQDSKEQYLVCAYEYGKVLMKAEKYVDAAKYFGLASGYQDAGKLKQEAEYQRGIQLLASKKYAEAITQFSKNPNYSEAANKILEAKYGYVKDHLNKSDKQTRTYLDDLIAKKYRDAQSLYNELYAWKVEIVAFNNSPYNQTNQNTVSKYQGMYCHFKVTGGEPGKTLNLKVFVTAPNGQTGTIYFNSCSDGSIWSTCFTYDNPYYGATGTMSVRIVDASTGREYDSGYVAVTN